MNETLDLFDPTTSEDTGSATSSPALEPGAMRSGLQDGPTTVKFGPEAAHVKRTPVRLEEGTLSQIGGLNGAGSSLQDALDWYLASRLPLPVVGSLASALTWKRWAMPSGRPISRLSPSVLTIYARGFTLRATPTATANQAAPSMKKHPGCRDLEVNPESFCLRMGLPIEWLACAPSAMRSTRMSPRSSSGSSFS